MGQSQVKFRASKVRRVPGQMNKLEKAYHDVLYAKLSESANVRLCRFKFEAVRLKLGTLCTYTPDFYLLYDDGHVEFHEVKGGIWIGDARAKLRMAVETYPEFTFVAVTRNSKKNGGGWEYEYFE
jgi:hypothetical protein